MAKYKKISQNIHRLIFDDPKANKTLTWININNAGKTEIELLRKKYNFNLSHLQASKTTAFAQWPKIEQGSGYLFLILHFPILQDERVLAREINFFISEEYVITIHNNDTTINNLFNLSKKDENSFLAYDKSPATLLYEILEKLTLGCYPMLDKNSYDITDIQKIIFAHEQRDAVSKILNLRHNIINLRKTMQSHKNIFKKLMEIDGIFTSDNNIKNFYKRLIEHTKTIWEILENQKETIEILYQTNESMLTYKLNDIMKTLTIFSVIVFPLTLLAAIFGMNTVNGMPFMEGKQGFWNIIGIMLLGSFFMLLFFKKKRWI